MHDVELLMCIHPVAPRLLAILDGLSAWERSRADRAPLIDELGELVTAELAGAAARWTPHYDRALRWFAAASASDLLDPAWSYAPDPSPSERFACARRDLAHHTYLCDQLSHAEARGARTLADAFEILVIPSDRLELWFALCPDLTALDRRLRAAARRYLQRFARADFEQELIDAVDQRRSRAEIHGLRLRCHHRDPSPERNCAFSILATELRPTQLDFAEIPLALLAELGNPFDPRV